MEDMRDLVVCWNAYMRLCDTLSVGAVAVEAGVLGDLGCILDVICRNSRLADPVIIQVLESEMTVEEKVERLLGD